MLGRQVCVGYQVCFLRLDSDILTLMVESLSSIGLKQIYLGNLFKIM